MTTGTPARSASPGLCLPTPVVTPAGTFGIDAHEQMGHAFMVALPDRHMDVSRIVAVGDEV